MFYFIRVVSSGGELKQYLLISLFVSIFTFALEHGSGADVQEGNEGP